MHRTAVLLAVCAAACGRVGFDALSDGASAGLDAVDASSTPRSLVLPTGGQISRITFAPNGDWYALSRTAGGFRSTDQGMTWTRCGARDGTAIAVTSDGAVWMSGLDVGRSVDNCATWTDTLNPRPSEAVFAEGANIWALCDTGLRKWGGMTWVVVTTPLDNNAFMRMAHGGARYFIGTLTQGVMTSPDAITWTQAPLTAFASPEIRGIAAGTNATYAITAGGNNNIACSDATGTTWTNCYGAGGIAIAVDPTNNQRAMAAIYDDLGVTTNGFGAVTRGIRQPSMDSAIVEDLSYLANGDIVAATDRGVFVAPSGTTNFAPRLAGLDAWDVDDISQDGDDIWVSTRGGPLHSVGGAPFTLGTSGITGNTTTRHVRVMPDGRLVAAGRNLYISADRGDTWSMLQAMNNTDGYYVADIAFRGTRMFVATGARLLVSDPPYTTYTPVTFPGGNHPANDLFVAGSNVWIGTDRGLHVSQDNGASILPIASLGTRNIRSILDLPDGRMLVGTTDGVWISDVAQTSFVRAGLSAVLVDGLTLVNDAVIAATAVGVRYTRDAGTTWTPLPGAETIPSSATLVDDTTGQLIVGTDTRGLIRVPLP
ncbi:MAG TPA: hypothetical protein VMZ53_28160 [Kofleriaceae bacterium]|nr:hypothetical protein [Kofleriaceae bacterium]